MLSLKLVNSADVSPTDALGLGGALHAIDSSFSRLLQILAISRLSLFKCTKASVSGIVLEKYNLSIAYRSSSRISFLRMVCSGLSGCTILTGPSCDLLKILTVTAN